MASYAPLFAHVEGWQWTPDLIWINNLSSYGTPDYYVQKLFSLHKGSKVVPITLGNDVIAGQDSLYASASIDYVTKELIIKLVNVSGNKKRNSLNIEGVKKLNGTGRLIVLQDDDLSKMNSFDQPTLVSPKESGIKIKGKKLDYTLPPHSLSIMRIKMQ
jgi:alpha-L-arabinofuranosidase